MRGTLGEAAPHCVSHWGRDAKSRRWTNSSKESLSDNGAGPQVYVSGL